MKRLRFPLPTLALTLAFALVEAAAPAVPSAPSAPAETTSPTTEAVAPNFRLVDHLGVSRELYRQREHRVVVLFVTGNGCPIVRNSLPELKRLREKFGPRGAGFALLNVNGEDSRDEVAREAQEFGIDFPILLDPSQNVGRALELHRTAEVLVIDTCTWRIRYRGAVDDRLGYGQQRPEASRHFLAEALEAVLTGTPVEQPRTEVKGCGIAYGTVVTPDYVRDIAPMVAANCTGCHSRGNVAPFNLDRYEKVRSHSATLRDVLLEDRMPPWHADSHHGVFANDRALSATQKAQLYAWIAAGAPRGEGVDPLPALLPRASGDWPLGEPDYVVRLPEEAKIPETGLVPYQVFTVKAPVTNDTWLRGVTIRAGNPKVVHHCLVFIRYPASLRHLEPRQDDGASGFFAGFVPGTDAVFFPPGTGKFLPSGSELVFQMHYTTTGREETDRTEMALYCAPGRPDAELITGAAATMDFEIPPGAPDHPVRAEFTFERDSILYELTPHMHLRGSRFAYAAEYPDGRREILLSVPAYDFNWQTLYRLATPKRIPAGTRLVCTGAYDNSPGNPSNPNAKAVVRFGEQTADEMFIGYFNYTAAPRLPEVPILSSAPGESGLRNP